MIAHSELSASDDHATRRNVRNRSRSVRAAGCRFGRDRLISVSSADLPSCLGRYTPALSWRLNVPLAVRGHRGAFLRALEELANRGTRSLLQGPEPTCSGIHRSRPNAPQLGSLPDPVVVLCSTTTSQVLRRHHRDLAQTWQHASTSEARPTLARAPRASPAAASGFSAALALSAFAPEPFFPHAQPSQSRRICCSHASFKLLTLSGSRSARRGRRTPGDTGHNPVSCSPRLGSVVTVGNG